MKIPLKISIKEKEKKMRMKYYDEDELIMEELEILEELENSKNEIMRLWNKIDNEIYRILGMKGISLSYDDFHSISDIQDSIERKINLELRNEIFRLKEERREILNNLLILKSMGESEIPTGRK